MVNILTGWAKKKIHYKGETQPVYFRFLLLRYFLDYINNLYKSHDESKKTKDKLSISEVLLSCEAYFLSS